MLSDPLLDYLKEYNIISIKDYNIISVKSPLLDYNVKIEQHNRENTLYDIKFNNSTLNDSYDIFTQHILNAGIEFESALIKIITRKHPIVQVAYTCTDSKCISKFNETIDWMKKGVPIIYQGVLHNNNNFTYGLPDLLVRSDYINKLLNYNVITNEEAIIPSPNLNINFHYKVIDIKHSTIYLKSDGIHILNSNSIPAYKGQIYIYMLALNNILGININKGFIWGKKYIYESKGKKYEISNFLNKLGTIDYNTVDNKYIELTNNAIKWIKTVKNESNNWTLLPLPCREELFPNMKNERDDKYNNFKNELNNKINEITGVWNCGIKRRKIAHNNNIYGWNDINCTSNNMGFINNPMSNTIDSILDINRQNNYIIKPNKIIYDRKNWKKCKKNEFEFYLDFETLNSNFGSIDDIVIEYNTNQYIFMIGVGYSKNNKWIFKTFIMKNKSHIEELNMFNRFYNYIKSILKKYNKKYAKFYHWSMAEPIVYNNLKKKYK